MLPADIERQLVELLGSVGNADGEVVAKIDSLLDSLDELLLQEKMVPEDRWPSVP